MFKFTPGCSAPAGPITRFPISPPSALPPSPVPGLHPWASAARNFGAVGRREDEHHLPVSSPRVFSSGTRSEGDKEQAAVTNAPFAPLPKRVRAEAPTCDAEGVILLPRALPSLDFTHVQLFQRQQSLHEKDAPLSWGTGDEHPFILGTGGPAPAPEGWTAEIWKYSGCPLPCWPEAFCRLQIFWFEERTQQNNVDLAKKTRWKCP